jgi:hypothetical protein
MLEFLKKQKAPAVPAYWIDRDVKPEYVKAIEFPETEGLPLTKKYTVKIDKGIYAKKDGSKKTIGTAYMILETHKFNLAKGGKRGTVLCDLKATHRFTIEGDTYNVHYTGSASLSLQPKPVHHQINELKSEYVKELKVGSLKPVAVFKNDKELYPGYDRIVNVYSNGKHTITPDAIGLFQWIVLKFGGG